MVVRWKLSAVLLLLFAVVVKTHIHVIRLVLLAAIGLAGMYMLHVLAQDYNMIRPPMKPGANVVKAVSKLLFKRSVPEFKFAEQMPLQSEYLRMMPNLDYILGNDPQGCARKVVCELAARPQHELLEDEHNILRMLRDTIGSQKQFNYALEKFRLADELGRRTRDQSACELQFRECQYTALHIFKLLRPS